MTDLEEFFRQASFYRYHADFQEHEREYKIQLANALAKSRELVTSNSGDWVLALDEAIKSKDDNIIYWEDRHAFCNWLSSQPIQVIGPLRTLWDESIDLAQRFTVFTNALAAAGLTQPGAQLAITSTLLMAFSPNEFPPVKVDSFSRSMKIAGWPGLYSAKTALDRYRLAQSFMDSMIKESSNFIVELRDRLDVQGVVWCISGGWKNRPVPGGWTNDPEQRASLEQAAYVKELRELEDEPGSRELTPTQKLSLVQARRGQGRFREDLVSYWDQCAVTDCSELRLLRASHIKPWKSSNNQERLDPFNGLLLSPNLDAAFDKGLISFEDSGRIKISRLLRASDKKALGISTSLCLRRFSFRHSPYLKHHRENIFKEK
jgi:hypothetical protein